jgi:hypothetical protein
MITEKKIKEVVKNIKLPTCDIKDYHKIEQEVSIVKSRLGIK